MQHLNENMQESKTIHLFNQVKLEHNTELMKNMSNNILLERQSIYAAWSVNEIQLPANKYNDIQN